MSQKTMLALAASLTAFILVIIGGVVGRVSSPATAAGPSVLQAWGQREAAYQDLIDQANQRLLAAERPSVAANAPVAAGQAYAANLSATEAAIQALMAAPGAGLAEQPELVEFQGIRAYEVPTTFGMVYIDAATGAVLYNGAARPMASMPRGSWETDDD